MGMLFRGAAALVVLLGSFASPVFAGGAIISVPGDQPTIQAAIDASSSGDTIELADMVFTGPGNRALDFQGKAITLRSAGGDAALCVIDCEKQSRGMQFDNGEGADTRIENLTIRNGLNASFGGGADIIGASPVFSGVAFEFCMSDEGGGASVRSGGAPTFENCSFTGCGATRGGGIFASISAPTVTGTVFDGNSADFGGAVYNSGTGASGRFVDCEFIMNEGVFGAGACNWTSSAPTYIGCTFDRNNGLPNSSGGGMHSRGSNVIVANALFTGNQGFIGGGLHSTNNATVQVVNGMFVDNVATSTGGGLSNTFGATTTVDNTTFTANSAATGGGVSTISATLEIVNSILWANTDDSKDAESAQIDNGATVSVAFSCVEQGWPGDGNIDSDPLLQAPELRLGAGSPCIDAGSTDLLASDYADLDGDMDTGELLPLDMALSTRISGSGVDMGPLERVESGCPADFNGDGQVAAFDLAQVLSAWGSDDAQADFNDDGIVDAFDLANLLSVWGPCPG